MNLKKIGKVLTSKSVGTGPSSYEKRIYRTAVSQRLKNNSVEEFSSYFIASTFTFHYKDQSVSVV